MERTPNLRPALACVTAGLAVTAVVVFLRRAAGAPLRDLPAGEAAVYTAAFAAAVASSTRILGDRTSSGQGRTGHTPIVSLLLTLVFLAGLSTDALTVVASLAAGSLVIGLDLLSAGVSRSATVPASQPDGPTAERPAPTEPSVTPVEGTVQPSGHGEETTVRLDRRVIDGRERLDGSIRFEVAAGETVKTLHVPLWPPLAAEPVVRCELDEIDGRVRVPYAKPHGFRIEVRLPEPVDEPLSGAVRFVADSGPASAAA